MSKADSINKKIRKAYGKVGNILGYPFEIYRPSSLQRQITDSTYIDQKKAAFAIDDKFSKAFTIDRVPVYTVYVDAMLENKFDLQQGDVFYSQETEETYITCNVENIKAIQAFKCNSLVSIHGTQYGDSGFGYSGSDTDVATNVPCYIDIKGFSGGNLGYIPASSYGSDPYDTATIYCWDPQGELSRSSIIEESNGRRWTVLSAVRTTAMATILEVEEQK